MKQKFLVTELLFVIAIGLVAAVINYFRLPLFFEAEFIFGQSLVLLVAIYRGPLMGVLAAIIASSILAFVWGSWWIILTLGLEAIFVAFVCRRNSFNLILAVVGYWILVGMPLSWISISSYDQFIDSHKFTILVKQVTNAIIYANIAAILMLIPPVKRLFSVVQKPIYISLKNQSAHIISTLLITIGILFFFFDLNQRINNSSEKANHTHQLKHQELYHQLALIIKANSESINELSHLLTEIWDDTDKRRKTLTQFNLRHPIFDTMLIADNQGDLINYSPPLLYEQFDPQQNVLNVADRNYFIHAMESSDVYVSPGFIGRGFGSDIIVAISKVILQDNIQEDKLGVIEGTIVLNSMDTTKHSFDNITTDVEAILIDQDSQVLMASDRLDFDKLSKVGYQKNTHVLKSEGLVNLIVNNEPIESQFYYIKESTFFWGWKLITLQNESVFAKVIEKSLLYFAVAILMVILISNILAKAISYSWLYHLSKLNGFIKRGNDFVEENSVFEGNDFLPEEVSNFYQEIKSSRRQIIKMNHDLQNAVAERTEKLQKANEKLNVLARQDELTGLENRRVFNDCLNELWVECQRELVPFSMIIIDVDHFKKLNDSYGHPIGDQILAFLGKEFIQFKNNEVKCLARIGGEEFCMLIKECNHQFVKEMAENIRSHIESLQIPIGEDKTIALTISCGVATIDATKYTSSRLYQLADNALYEAKHSGRNKIKAYEEA